MNNVDQEINAERKMQRVLVELVCAFLDIMKKTFNAVRQAEWLSL